MAAYPEPAAGDRRVRQQDRIRRDARRRAARLPAGSLHRGRPCQLMRCGVGRQPRADAHSAADARPPPGRRPDARDRRRRPRCLGERAAAADGVERRPASAEQGAASCSSSTLDQQSSSDDPASSPSSAPHSTPSPNSSSPQSLRIAGGGLESAPCVRYTGVTDAGWSSSVARWAHNPEVAGSNPAPATKEMVPAGISGRDHLCASGSAAFFGARDAMR